MTQCICLHLQLLGQIADADDADFELVAGQILGRFNQVANALAFNVATNKQDFEFTIHCMRLGVPRTFFKSRAIRTPFDFNIAKRLDFTGGKTRVREHGLSLANGKLQERLDPFLLADEQEFGAVEIQHQRNFEQLSSAQRNVGVRERPMGMNHIGLKLAANFNALEEPADDIGNRQKLEPRLVGHLGRSTFFMSQELPARRCITESVYLDSINFVAL